MPITVRFKIEITADVAGEVKILRTEKVENSFSEEKVNGKYINTKTKEQLLNDVMYRLKDIGYTNVSPRYAPTVKGEHRFNYTLREVRLTLTDYKHYIRQEYIKKRLN